MNSLDLLCFDVLGEYVDPQRITVAADRAKVALWEKNRVTESFSIETYGSDRAVAGALVYIKTSEVQGYFWIDAVRHVYGTPHRMTMTLRRSDYTPPEGALSDDMGEALRET